MPDALNEIRLLYVRDWLAGLQDKALELPNDARRAYLARLQEWRDFTSNVRSFHALVDRLDQTRKHILSAAVPAQMGAQAADKFLHCFCQGLLVANAIQVRSVEVGARLK